jgi:nicotinate phosphoribosyltransferase
VEEVVHRLDTPVEVDEHDRVVPVPLVVKGETATDLPTLEESREHLRRGLVAVPWEGLKLSRGEPAIPTTFVP